MTFSAFFRIRRRWRRRPEPRGLPVRPPLAGVSPETPSAIAYRMMMIGQLADDCQYGGPADLFGRSWSRHEAGYRRLAEDD